MGSRGRQAAAPGRRGGAGCVRCLAGRSPQARGRPEPGPLRPRPGFSAARPGPGRHAEPIFRPLGPGCGEPAAGRVSPGAGPAGGRAPASASLVAGRRGRWRICPPRGPGSWEETGPSVWLRLIAGMVRQLNCLPIFAGVTELSRLCGRGAPTQLLWVCRLLGVVL